MAPAAPAGAAGAVVGAPGADASWRPGFERRFARRLRRLLHAGPAPLVVAVSGGADSVTLLHLMRFSAALPGVTLVAAHYDHGTRPGSECDADWVAGLCRAWGVPLLRERAARPPRGEDEARRLRHAFLQRVAEGVGAQWVLTAHHADDQAETVLFRVLRGTGVAGLAGIAARRPPGAGGPAGYLRPLLPFWRSEVRRYARAVGLAWREDPSNARLHAARNRLRHDLIPRAEATVAPGARRSLVRLAALARRAERGWAAVEADAMAALLSRDGEALLLARHRLQDYDSAVAHRVLRNALRQYGTVLSRAGTRTALRFLLRAPSGRTLQLPGGVRLSTEYDRARIWREAPPLPDVAADIPAHPPAGSAALRLDGRAYRAAWRRGGGADPAATSAPRWSVQLEAAALRFPLTLRGWRAGDRMAVQGGSRTLKSLFAAQRVPRSERVRRPVLADAEGTPLWVAGLATAAAPLWRGDGAAFSLSITDD